MLINTTVRSLITSALLFFTGVSHAQVRNAELYPNEDPRGEVELTVCSQNLENYGSPASMRQRGETLTLSDLTDKEDALIARFLAAKCDVIAVQEVLGSSAKDGEVALKRLALAIRLKTGRFFEVTAGETNDQTLHNGVLVATDRATISNRATYARAQLPKMTRKEKARFFSRGPFEVQLTVKPQGESAAKTVTLVIFHFKSQVGGEGDPAALQWETFRMQSAEALRRIVENRHKDSFISAETLLVVLGDRNSNFDTATAKILEGSLTLPHFQQSAPCRLSKRGVPLCKAGAAGAQKLFSVLTRDPIVKNRPGTYINKKKAEYSWLDEILLPAETLRFANKRFDSTGSYDSGVIYEPKEASDHALVFTRLNW